MADESMATPAPMASTCGSSSSVPAAGHPEGQQDARGEDHRQRQPLHARERLAHAGAEQDVGCPRTRRPPGPARAPVASIPAPPALASSRMPAAASVTHTRSSAPPRAQHRNCQRSREFNRHRHALRDPVDRLVEAQVHERQRHAEGQRQAELTPAVVAPARRPDRPAARARRTARAGRPCRWARLVEDLLGQRRAELRGGDAAERRTPARGRRRSCGGRSPPPRYLQSGGCPSLRTALIAVLALLATAGSGLGAPQRGAGHDRRPDPGVDQGHDQDQGAGRRAGHHVHQLGGHVPAVLPVAGHLPERPVRAQPRGAEQRAAVRRLHPLRPGQRAARVAPAAPATAPCTWAARSTATAPTRPTSPTVPPGWNDWVVPLEPTVYDYERWRMNENGQILELPRPGPPREFQTDYLGPPRRPS